jgi:hypothetical protein
MPLKGTRKKTTKKPTKNQTKVVSPAPPKRKRKPPKPKTPLDAIHKKCRECCCGTLAEVQACEIDDCALWHYRMAED